MEPARPCATMRWEGSEHLVDDEGGSVRTQRSGGAGS